MYMLLCPIEYVMYVDIRRHTQTYADCLECVLSGACLDEMSFRTPDSV